MTMLADHTAIAEPEARGYREFQVFGPPGTGKTTGLRLQINRAAQKHGSHEILVASFTKAAAAEIAGRGLAVDERNVSTLHSHAMRAVGHSKLADDMLEDWNASVGESLALSVGGKKWAAGDAAEMDMEQSYATDGDRRRSHYERLRNRLTPRELWPVSALEFAREWEKWKTDRMVIDFTDMIELALRDTISPLGRPSVGFFDEAQDFTPLELALMRKWAASMEYVVAGGDDDQCIYEFKGASPVALLDDSIPDGDKRVLEQSYRVPGAVHRIVDRWVRQIKRRQPKHWRPRREFLGNDHDGRAIWGETVEGEARALSDASYARPDVILTDAEPYLAEGKTVLILGACSYMLDGVIKSLRRQGIPFHNPLRANPRWNPLAPARKGATRTADRLLAYLRPDPGVWGSDARMWDSNDIRAWLAMVRADGLLMKGAKTRIQGDQYLSEDDILALFNPAADDLGDILTADLDALARRTTKEYSKSLEFPLNVARQRGAAALTREPQVKVGTIHSYKGGEADVVYLFPDLSGPSNIQWRSGGEDQDGIVRLFYVGMTRARESLILCGPAGPHVPLARLAPELANG